MQDITDIFDIEKFKQLCKGEYKIASSYINIYILSCTYHIRTCWPQEWKRISFLSHDMFKGSELYPKVKYKLEKLWIIKKCKYWLFQIL